MMKLRKNKLKFNVAFFLAIKNLFFKKSMLISIIIIIGLGFLSMTIASGIILGLENTIEGNNVAHNTGNVLIEPIDKDVYVNNVYSIKAKALSLPQVISVSSHIKKSITILDNSGNKVSTQILIGNKDDIADTLGINNIIVSGNYFSSGSDLEIVVGKEFIKELSDVKGAPTIDVSGGENVVLETQDGKKVNVKVVGIFDADLIMANQKMFMTQDTAKKIFGFTNKDFNVASEITIKTIPGTENDVIYKLKELGVDGEIYHWKDRLGFIDQTIGSLLIISNFTQIIGIIISFAIVFIMIYINVLQKRSQIGIMKAIGINEKTILLSYVLQSLFYGFVGSIFGFFLTKGIISIFTKNPIVMPLGSVIPYVSFNTYINTILILIISSLIAGYFASRGVIKEKVLDAIFKG